MFQQLPFPDRSNYELVGSWKCLGRGWLEGRCFVCNEPLLAEADDKISLFVDDEKKKVAALCLGCVREFGDDWIDL